MKCSWIYCGSLQLKIMNGLKKAGLRTILTNLGQIVIMEQRLNIQFAGYCSTGLTLVSTKYNSIFND